MKSNFTRSVFDNCLYFKDIAIPNDVYLLLYVNNMHVAGFNCDMIQDVKEHLKSKFDIKDLGSTKTIWGINIDRNCSKLEMKLSQSLYLKRLFSTDTTNIANVLLGDHFKLSSDLCPSNDLEKEDILSVLYSNVIGYVMYTMICTWLDWSHVVSVISRYMSNSCKIHCEAMKWLLR